MSFMARSIRLGSPRVRELYRDIAFVFFVTAEMILVMFLIWILVGAATFSGA